MKCRQFELHKDNNLFVVLYNPYVDFSVRLSSQN